jgi:hypothetical protein
VDSFQFACASAFANAPGVFLKLKAASRTVLFAQAILPQVTDHHDPYDALCDAEAVLICTECPEFRQLWECTGKLVARRLVIDVRNLRSPARMRELDLEYFSFGRGLIRGGRTEVRPGSSSYPLSYPADSADLSGASEVRPAARLYGVGREFWRRWYKVTSRRYAPSICWCKSPARWNWKHRR